LSNFIFVFSRKSKWKLWNLGTNYLTINHHVEFPVQGTKRFPNLLIKTYQDVWTATSKNASESNIRGTEEDWKSTFAPICSTRKTLIPAPNAKISKCRVTDTESQALLAFKRKVDEQWQWMNTPQKKSKKKKEEGETYS